VVRRWGRAALEVSLFDRVGRRLVLNQNGRALLPGAMALLEQAGELQGVFESAHHAPLRVAASLTIGEYLLPQIIARWQVDHRDSPVQLTIGNTSKVIQAVVGMEVDVGFIEGPQTHADLSVQRWLEDELILVAAPDHPLARRAATHRQLTAATWILREPASGTRQAADAWLLDNLGTLHVQYELGSTEAIKRLAAAGAGLACVSRHAVTAELARGSLKEVRSKLPRARRRLAIVVRRDRRLGRSAQDFVRHCTG
jgi:DNA-binding transcriptional LysR family regulator